MTHYTLADRPMDFPDSCPICNSDLVSNRHDGTTIKKYYKFCMNDHYGNDISIYLRLPILNQIVEFHVDNQFLSCQKAEIISGVVGKCTDIYKTENFGGAISHTHIFQVPEILNISDITNLEFLQNLVILS